MLDELRRALESAPTVAYALVFGSTARGSRHSASDVDVAVELQPEAPRDVRSLGTLAAHLEAAVGGPIDLVLLDEAPPAVAYRAFRDGRPVLVRDRAALVARKARVILDYLDFRPVEERCAAGVLRRAAAGGR